MVVGGESELVHRRLGRILVGIGVGVRVSLDEGAAVDRRSREEGGKRGR